MAQDKHRNEFKHIDLDPKEMATSLDIMHHLDEIERSPPQN